MLILTRRAGESIVIGNNVVVKIVEVRGDQIRLGIEAPRDVQVHREEVYREIEAHNTRAASSVNQARKLAARMPRPVRQESAQDAPPSADERASPLDP